ncbi:MAG: phosphonoacetaldehyde hydrolase [Candidatus Binataceae bacterium]
MATRREPYRGSLRAAVLDWAGTTVDHGSLAPVRTIQRVFAQWGVSIAVADARRDMGLLKKDHIRKILSIPAVSDAWRARFGHPPAEADVEGVFADFVPLQLACLAEHCAVIDGVVGTVARLRRRGLRIGSTTGYTREILDLLMRYAAEQGYQPDCAITPDEVGGGRPHPWMIFENAIRLQVEPLAAIVKIGDTPADIEEGLRAGVWTVGVARTGNMVGLSASDFAALPATEREKRLERARIQLSEAGAHAVIDSLSDCEPALEEIEKRLRAGERP